MPEISAAEAAVQEALQKRKGRFFSYVLLSRPSWNRKAFLRNLAETFGIVRDENDDPAAQQPEDGFYAEIFGHRASIGLVKEPIRDPVLEQAAEQNFLWAGAGRVAREHQAYLVVEVESRGNVYDAGLLFVSLMVALSSLKYVQGILQPGCLQEPAWYRKMALDMRAENLLPIQNWVWFGIRRTETGHCAYTVGMELFGKEEMEVVSDEQPPEKLHELLYAAAVKTFVEDRAWHDGDTLSFLIGDAHRITRSEGVGVSVPTLKIEYGQGLPDSVQGRADGVVVGNA